MRLIKRILLGLLLTYLVIWGAVAAYFSYAETHKQLLESNLSQVFKRVVSIDEVRTVWRGVNPRIQINGFKVEGDVDGQPALAFDSLATELSPSSLLRLWPRFTEFALEKPVLEVVLTESGKLQIAGIELSKKGEGAAIPEKVLSWLLDQKGGVWHDGEVVWRRAGAQTRRYKNISFVYERRGQTRSIQTAVITDKGPLAFKAISQGDILSDDLWDASLEVLGEQGQNLLTSEDLSLHVDSGKGRLQLKELGVQRIRDFIRLAGLSHEARWLENADLKGRLFDFKFDFSGPLMRLEDWRFEASAADVEFKSVGSIPGMSKLRGKLRAAAAGGNFEFVTIGSSFVWPRWFDQEFPIRQANGELAWEIDVNGGVMLSLIGGELEDGNVRVSNLAASCKLDAGARTVSNFGQLFKVDSVSDLSYQDGLLVNESSSAAQRPLTLNASAEFEFADLSKVAEYLPNDPRIDKFRSWSENAFLSGVMTNGKASYTGEVSRNALQVGKAQLDATADFDNVMVDYGYQQNWPKAERGRGKASIKNELLTIRPDEIWLNGDPVTESQLQIAELFRLSRYLTVNGKTSTSLKKGLDFLFKGPLIKPENQLKEFPLEIEEGVVDIQTLVEIPLGDLKKAKVRGQAYIRKGRGLIQPGVPISNVSASVDFTERSVSSKNIKANFLGNKTSAKLVTVKEAQPPIMKLTAEGEANAVELEQWIGEHLLTWFDGTAPWQGELLIDGPKLELSGTSDLEGVTVSAPAPLAKKAQEKASMDFSMTLGGKSVQQQLALKYKDDVQVRFKANKAGQDQPSLFDNSLISIGSGNTVPLRPGINFAINDSNSSLANSNRPTLDLDEWLSAVIDLASYKTKVPSKNSDFLDAMRSINVSSTNPVFLGREFGAMNVSVVSVDGANWIGTVDGDNIKGTMRLSPRSAIGSYAFDLERLNLVERPKSSEPPTPIDYSLKPAEYPEVSLVVEKLGVAGKNMGRLVFAGQPREDEWMVDELALKLNGIGTVARGKWSNNKAAGSMTSFDFATVIDEAGGALTDMDFDGIIRKGEGSIEGRIQWQGAPHEFDYARLDGEFDLRLKDGELVQVEPGGGKLLGLLNFNAIARRLVFDFSDVFASGLKFDRMQYTGLLANGEAIFREAYIFTPAVFVRMEGKLNLDKELIDMEVHLSPELGGNLALLSALANPTAGAVVYITQRIFQDEMRDSNFKSYRALGTWKDFKMEELKTEQASKRGLVKEPSANKEPSASKEPSADREPSANREPSVNKEPSDKKQSATAKPLQAEPAPL